MNIVILSDKITIARIQMEVRSMYYGFICNDKESNGVQGVQTRLKRKDRFESK